MTGAIPPLSPEAFQAETGVSRETLARLEAYAKVLMRWQEAINLVARPTLADVWRRHFLDSAQLYPLLPAGTRRLVDLGSGAGFPGLVLAIMGVPDVHLIESDQKKAAFLREAARETRTKVTIHARPIAETPVFPVEVVTARALAPLDRLLGLAAPFLAGGAIGLFLKGKDVESELTEAAKNWIIDYERVTSRSDPTGAIILVKASARTGERA